MEPSSIRSGDSITWTRDEAIYTPADGWTLTYRLIPTAGTATDIATTGSGSTYTATLSATATAALAVGRCRLVGYVSKSGEYHTVHDDAAFQVLENLRTKTASDPRSAAEIELAAAKAAWAQGKKSYSFADREVVFHDSADMLVRIRYLEQQVANETYLAEIGAGREAAPPGRIQYRSAG